MRRSKSIVCAVLVLAAVLPLAPPAHAEEAPAPVPLTAWEYRHDPGDEGLAAGWAAGGPADGWQPATVPHVLDPRPLAGNFGGTVAWYRTVVNPPPGGPGWIVRFGQARRSASVWLNGVPIGANTDPYAPFEVRVPGPGLLVVRVENRRPGSVREGWWNWGGLTRPVTLVPAGAPRMEDLGVMPRIRCSRGACRGSVLLDVTLVNDGAEARPASVGLRVASLDATIDAGVLAPGESRRVRRELAVPEPVELWWPQSPRLYDARVELRSGGALSQAEQLRVGFRSVRVRRGMLTLNGRVLDLRGASIQEDVEGRGPALTDADVERIVADLKEVGANVTRAHYALDERLLRRFDEEGILVWNQAPVYHADRTLRRAAGRRQMLSRVRSAVVAARSHPSVITTSVANELAAKADDMPGTRSFLDRAARLARALDPTRPVSLDVLSYPNIPYQRVYERFGMLGINNYFGWYAGKPRYSTRDFGDLAPYLRGMHERYPRHALVMTEFGAEALHDGDARRKGTYSFQARYLARVLDVVDRARFLGGAIYWTLQEFAVKPGWDGGVGTAAGTQPDGIHKKGLISYDGARKPAWQVAHDRFAATPLYR